MYNLFNCGIVRSRSWLSSLECRFRVCFVLNVLGLSQTLTNYCQYIIPHTVSVLSLILSVSCPHRSGGDGISQKGLATQKKIIIPISWVLNHFLQVIRTNVNGPQNHALLFMWCSIQIMYQVLYLDKALTVLLVPWERTRSTSVLQHEEDGRWHQIVTVSWFSCKSMIECPSRPVASSGRVTSPHLTPHLTERPPRRYQPWFNVGFHSFIQTNLELLSALALLQTLALQ